MTFVFMALSKASSSIWSQVFQTPLPAFQTAVWMGPSSVSMELTAVTMSSGLVTSQAYPLQLGISPS